MSSLLVFNRVYRLEIQTAMLVFSTQLCERVQNLQNCYTTPNKNLEGEGPQTDKHLPQSTFTGQFFR